MYNISPSTKQTLEERFPNRHDCLDEMYCFLKLSFIAENPNASPDEYDAAIAEICERIGY